jgi:hypothetical protein
MSRARDKIIAQKSSKIFENGSIAGRMETMAAVVHALIVDIKAPRVSADDATLLDYGHAGTVQAP